ncbi:MAG TPA: ATP-binding cassette domain-containing protein [Solirubrobacteraceae bacterium]
MSAVLEAAGLSAGYAGAAVVRDLDLEVHAGEVVAILGPNGAGKTTTMLTLAGDLRPIAGETRFCGAATKAPLHRRARGGLALITEERSLAMSLTVRQNIAIGRCDAGRVTALFPELEPMLGRRTGLLSGGEQQMLALGRALARRNTKALLADELSLGLAPKLVGRLLEGVRAAADDGVAVLLVEQHVHRVLDIADRVYVLAHGRVEYRGNAADARERIDEISAHYLSSNNGGSPSRAAVD